MCAEKSVETFFGFGSASAGGLGIPHENSDTPSIDVSFIEGAGAGGDAGLDVVHDSAKKSFF